jgi:hypothetical protein
MTDAYDLIAQWSARAASFRMDANRLGNCQRGKEAFIEATTIERCVADLTNALRQEQKLTALPALRELLAACIEANWESDDVNELLGQFFDGESFDMRPAPNQSCARCSGGSPNFCGCQNECQFPGCGISQFPGPHL